MAEAGRRVARPGSLADLRQHFVEEDTEQLAAFRAAPILHSSAISVFVADRTTPSFSIRRRDISSEMSNGDPLASITAWTLNPSRTALIAGAHGVAFFPSRRHWRTIPINSSAVSSFGQNSAYSSFGSTMAETPCWRASARRRCVSTASASRGPRLIAGCFAGFLNGSSSNSSQSLENYCRSSERYPNTVEVGIKAGAANGVAACSHSADSVKI